MDQVLLLAQGGTRLNTSLGSNSALASGTRSNDVSDTSSDLVIGTGSNDF